MTADKVFDPQTSSTATAIPVKVRWLDAEIGRLKEEFHAVRRERDEYALDLQSAKAALWRIAIFPVSAEPPLFDAFGLAKFAREAWDRLSRVVAPDADKGEK